MGHRTLPPELPEPDRERVVTLAQHYGAEVLTNWCDVSRSWPATSPAN
jgi:hypothetical protein